MAQRDCPTAPRAAGRRALLQSTRALPSTAANRRPHLALESVAPGLWLDSKRNLHVGTPSIAGVVASLATFLAVSDVARNGADQVALWRH